MVGELREAVLGAGMRFGIYYSGGLDSTFNDRPIGSVADSLDAIPRGDYPAYAEAQVRELIARYRPSVLWNDVAWPTAGNQLWPLFADYYDCVPDGVVNDRWMPWSALFATTRTKLGRRAIDAVVRQRTRRDGGLIPPLPPHCDVRTPEYVVFDEIQRKPWECVRGMDKSFAYNAESLSEHFLTRDELLWMVTDIAAKGGNLLLNVGPRGIDARIPANSSGAWNGSATGLRHVPTHSSPPGRGSRPEPTLPRVITFATPHVPTPSTRSYNTPAARSRFRTSRPHQRPQSRASMAHQCRGKTGRPAW